MIPGTNNLLSTEIELKTQPSKNYKMDYMEQTIKGYRDDLSAMEQVIYKILNTERYQYQIYSWNYGIELADLLGEPVSYVCPEIERRITEALTQDERIESVNSFEFSKIEKGIIQVNFIVHTIYGDISAERMVNY